MSLAGHVSIVRPWLTHALRPRPEPPSVPWSGLVSDPTIGAVRLRGRLSARRGGGPALVMVHGRGGSSAAHYLIEAAIAAEAAGFDVLRLNLRGAAGEGNDFYNAGLSADLRAVIAPGKIPSGRELLTLELAPTAKVIDEVRARDPAPFMIEHQRKR